MERINRKLKSRDGVSILIALVGFMFAAMISMVVVTAAVTAVGRVANDRTSNQDHLTLESAAQIIVYEIENTECTFYDDGTGNTVYTCTGAFADEMQEAVKAVDSRGIDYSAQCCTVSLADDTADVSAVEDVTASFVMNAGTEAEGEKYDLTFTVTLPDSQQELYLTVNGSCQLSDNNKYHITWHAVSINRLV